MSYSTPQIKPQICCPNSICAAPLNPLGSRVCDSCQTPLIYRYLWAVGSEIEQISIGSQVAGRYYVTSPKIWLDTQPSLPPDAATSWPDEVMPYLYLYPHRLHVPEVYGFCLEDGAETSGVFLLENVPLDANGTLYPAIAQVWTQATAVRQVYWLWQMLQLWTPLLEQEVASSLLSASNIRVEGWRIRLCQLYEDAEVLPMLTITESNSNGSFGLADLANLWLSLAEGAQPEVAQPLQAICRQMQQEGVETASIATQLNQLLLEQAAQLPLRLEIAGGTDQGPQRSHNEDTCYPITLNTKPGSDGLMPRLAIVCDGIGGHEGGEVASQTAVRSLKLQIQALLAEVAEQPELATPELLTEQLEAIVRVVNNLIATQNDNQGREDRRRMGTTLVMALQLPQKVNPAEGSLSNSHELYLVHVGDSRAYWITPRYCHQLTVDDDVAAREVRMGRALYRESLSRSDAGSLTQAIGTRNAEFLHPTIRRFILEEDGLLLLCSDGLSDNGLVEQAWTEHTEGVLKGKQPLELAVETWIALANQKNGYDNTSVILMRCQVSSQVADTSLPLSSQSNRADTEWTSASRSLQDELTEPGRTTHARRTGVTRRSRTLVTLLTAVAVLLLGSGIGLFAWSQLNPNHFQQFRDRVLPPSPLPNQPE